MFFITVVLFIVIFLLLWHTYLLHGIFKTQLVLTGIFYTATK